MLKEVPFNLEAVMKKVLSILFVLMVSVSVFAQGAKEGSGFTESPFKEPVSVRVVALKGPTAMGMVELMDKSSAGLVDGNKYEFSLEASPDAVVPQLVKGAVDIAAIPANLASVIYNNTGKVEVLGINTLGVLYICGFGDSEIKSVDDVRGKTIYASGKGSTPQYALETILSALGLADGRDVFIEWKSEHAECVAALIASGGSALAMLPQPFATTAMVQNNDIHILYDLNNAWESISGTPLVTGVVVASKAFADQHRDAVDSFLKSYRESVDFVNANTAEAAELIEKYGIIKAAVAAKALPYCNITLITGDELKNALTVYLQALYSQNPKSIGGKLPADEFYY